MDTSSDTYRDSVEAFFKDKGFCEVSFKNCNDWREKLDGSFNWDTFDYRIPCYEHSKSVDNAIDNYVANATPEIENFVHNNERK